MCHLQNLYKDPRADASSRNPGTKTLLEPGDMPLPALPLLRPARPHAPKEKKNNTQNNGQQSGRNQKNKLAHFAPLSRLSASNKKPNAIASIGDDTSTRPTDNSACSAPSSLTRDAPTMKKIHNPKNIKERVFMWTLYIYFTKKQIVEPKVRIELTTPPLPARHASQVEAGGRKACSPPAYA